MLVTKNNSLFFAFIFSTTLSASVHSSDLTNNPSAWNFVELDSIQVSGGGSIDLKGYGLEVSKELGQSFFADLAYYKYDFSDSLRTIGYSRTLVGAGYKTPLRQNMDFFAQLSLVTLTPVNTYTNLGRSSNFTDLSVGLTGNIHQFGYKLAVISSQSSQNNGASSDSGFSVDLYYLLAENWSAGLEMESFKHEDEKSISARYHF